RIGIDAKWYFGGPPSGVRVIQNLLRALIEFDKENEYTIFLDQKFSSEKCDELRSDNVTLVYLWAGNNLISNVLVLPFIARSYKLDVLMFQNFVSPLYTGRKIVYIFDVLFKSYPSFFTAKERGYFFPIKYLAWFADGIVTLSKEEKKRLVKYGYAPEDKIESIYLGVDSTFKNLSEHDSFQISEVKKRYCLPDRFLLYVGRLNSRKNIENLIRAIPQLNDKSIPLVIAGKEDWKHSNYRELAEKAGIVDRIFFTGWTAEIDLPIIYALSTVFCFPSFAEGFGLPPLEAMASGVPTVVSNTTSLPEICGNAPMYISPEKPEETANAINQLLSDQALRDAKIAEGLRHVFQFDWHTTARHFHKILIGKRK
ncbi:MAG: glycosyltransferase family 4 protein, partial [Flammeovirgaceae bacterium]